MKDDTLRLPKHLGQHCQSRASVSITDYVLRKADELAATPALIDGISGEEWTFSDLRDKIRSFAGGLAVVKVGRLHGYIDKRGKTVIEPQFSFARAFHRGLAYVGQGRSSGYIGPDGRYVWRSDAP